MTQIIFFIIVTILGVGANALIHINPIEMQYFPSFASAALIIGLYVSVLGIDLKAVAEKRTVALIVITIAVPIQILAAGFITWLIYPVGLSFLVAVAMTQIDPISVDTLLHDKDKMSKQAKGLLRIWASFDDPVTVIFGFLVLLPLLYPGEVDTSMHTILLGLAANFIPSLILFLLHRYTKLFKTRWVLILTLMATLIFAFVTQAYFLASVAGILLRPFSDRVLQPITQWIYYLVVFIVGMAIYNYGVDVKFGAILALVEFFIIQPLAAILFFEGTSGDLLRIAFSQQNGLTTLLMGITFQSLGYPVLPILLPSIVIVNLLNLAINKAISYKERRGLIL